MAAQARVPAHARSGAGAARRARGRRDDVGKPAPRRTRKLGRVLTVVAVLAVALLSVAGVMARYITVQDREAEMIAAGFHMSSDTLEAVGDGVVPSYEVACGVDGSFAVNLYNWEVANVSSVSEVEITYKVRVENGKLREGSPVTSGALRWWGRVAGIPCSASRSARMPRAGSLRRSLTSCTLFRATSRSR